MINTLAARLYTGPVSFIIALMYLLSTDVTVLAGPLKTNYAGRVSIFVGAGAMDKQSLNRINAIGQSCWVNHKISNSDLTWALGLLIHGPIKPTDNAHEFLTTKVIFSILLCRHFTGSQAALIDQTAAAMAESQHWDDRLWSVHMLMHTHDLAATPILNRLAQDPNRSVAAAAKAELQKPQQ